ncbi:MAG: helix-turn-helix domain-containing protein, partial [Anaerotignaceae bacterium]
TYFIKEDKKVIGILCINFDDSRYRHITNELMELCHPHNFIKQTYVYQDTFHNIPQDNVAEDFHISSEEIIDEILAKISTNFTVSLTHLKLNEKLDIVAQLDENGVFHIKGAVKYVAEKLNCSQASLYRYLKQSKKKI